MDGIEWTCDGGWLRDLERARPYFALSTSVDGEGSETLHL